MTRTPQHVIAECEEPGCYWYWDAQGGTRQAREHAKATGHRVRAEATKVYTYDLLRERKPINKRRTEGGSEDVSNG